MRTDTDPQKLVTDNPETDSQEEKPVNEIVPRLRPRIAYTAKLLLLNRNTIETEQTDFKKLKQRHGLDMSMLLKMEEDGLIEIKNCNVCWDIIPYYQAICKRHARLYGYHGAPSDLPDEETKEWHEPFYRNHWPFSKQLYDDLTSIRSLDRCETPTSLEEIKRPERFPIWLTVDSFDHWLFLRFDLVLPIKKVEGFLDHYADAFIKGSTDDMGERFTYAQHKEKVMLFLRDKVGRGIDPNNIWIVPSGEGYEHYKDMQFVWSKEETALARPLETVLSMEREGLMKIKEIIDNSLGAPDHLWGFFLQYKVSVTPEALKLMDLAKPILELEPLENAGLVAHRDDQDPEGSINKPTTAGPKQTIGFFDAEIDGVKRIQSGSQHQLVRNKWLAIKGIVDAIYIALPPFDGDRKISEPNAFFSKVEVDRFNRNIGQRIFLDPTSLSEEQRRFFEPTLRYLLDHFIVFYEDRQYGGAVMTAEPLDHFFKGNILIQDRQRFEEYHKAISDFCDFIENDGYDRFAETYHPRTGIEGVKKQLEKTVGEVEKKPPPKIKSSIPKLETQEMLPIFFRGRRRKVMQLLLRSAETWRNSAKCNDGKPCSRMNLEREAGCDERGFRDMLSAMRNKLRQLPNPKVEIENVAKNQYKLIIKWDQ